MKRIKILLFLLIVISLVAIALVSEPTIDGTVLFTFDASAQGLASSGGRAGVSTGASAGGGGDSTGRSDSFSDVIGGIPQQPDISTKSIKVSKNSHKTSPNQEISSYFTVEWESDNKIIVRDIDVDDETNEYIFEDTPFILNAFGFLPNKSDNKIFYKININPEPEQTTTNNIVTIGLELDGVSYTTDTNIKLDGGEGFDILELIKSFFARFRLSLSEQSLI